MTDAIDALERATARVAACDGSRLDEMAAAVEERAAAIERLTAEPATAETVDRMRAALEAGDAVSERLRGLRVKWRAELEETERALRYAADLGAGRGGARGQLDVAG